jgi:hypothetical protein
MGNDEDDEKRARGPGVGLEIRAPLSIEQALGIAVDRVTGLCVRCRQPMAEASEAEREAGEHEWCVRRGRERGR